MAVKKVLITGAGGLVGYEASKFFLSKGWKVIGVENNMRKYFFGEGGSIEKTLLELASRIRFKNFWVDIRDRVGLEAVYKEQGPFDLVIHAAAQTAHEWGDKEPLTDFDINAVGTINNLEYFRRHSPKGVFVFLSSVKVYGARPNEAEIVELETRFDYGKSFFPVGIREGMRIDQTTHALYGASKTAGDLVAQEYGKSFGLNVGIFRPGCITGPQHAAVEAHGFLAYLVDCAKSGKLYTINGYEGKQVRDQIHSKDVVSAVYEFYKNPKQGEVYNLGGGKENSVSIIEAIGILESEFGLKVNYTDRGYPRVGDQKVCYMDTSKFRRDYPNWQITIGVKEILKELVEKR